MEDLPLEVRARIFKNLDRASIPKARLVCKDWKKEIDNSYEFILDIAGGSEPYYSTIYNWRCRECTIWFLGEGGDFWDSKGFFRYPNYLKKLKINGVIRQSIVQHLLTQFDNLEHLTISRRAGEIKVLNLSLTPELAKLVNLKYLSINLPTLRQYHRVPEDSPTIEVDENDDNLCSLYYLPMMDCYFPNLLSLEFFKRFPKKIFSKINLCLFKFLARHAKTIANLEITLLIEPTNQFVRVKDLVRNHPINDASLLTSLSQIRLQKLNVAMWGSRQDALVWKTILENQNKLKELQFEWIFSESGSETRARLFGFCWKWLKPAILESSQHLEKISLIGISMIHQGSYDLRDDSAIGIMPFDMSIFKNCERLSEIVLRCNENHGSVRFPVEILNPFDIHVRSDDDTEQPDADLEDFNEDELEPRQVPLIINATDIPHTITKLEIASLHLFTTDLREIFQKCVQMENLSLRNCGTEWNLGVTAVLLEDLAVLTKLKFLDINGFNDIIIVGQPRNLEFYCQILGNSYEMEDTWLTYDDSESTAYFHLKRLRDFLDL